MSVATSWSQFWTTLAQVGIVLVILVLLFVVLGAFASWLNRND